VAFSWVLELFFVSLNDTLAGVLFLGVLCDKLDIVAAISASRCCLLFVLLSSVLNHVVDV
jgi:hypothetical protein